MSEKNTRAGRRRFLKSAALASGAAAVAVVVGAAVAESTSSGPTTERSDTAGAKGYHVTPHIEAYYRLARQ